MTWLVVVPGGCELRVKVVPGASRSMVAGVLGDRLKLRIAAPPEDGRANRAVEGLLEGLTGCTCTVTTGQGHAQKTILVAGGQPPLIRAKLV